MSMQAVVFRCRKDGVALEREAIARSRCVGSYVSSGAASTVAWLNS